MLSTRRLVLCVHRLTISYHAPWCLLLLACVQAEDPSRRQVSEEEGRAAAAQFNATYIETSAFNNDNVSAAFETLVK